MKTLSGLVAKAKAAIDRLDATLFVTELLPLEWRLSVQRYLR